mmetsp:Transcript_55568/g.146602  ORF Transcript_55568/g.146602 Transcript_55568/m.146602 type:complete len:99 (-) Transcript_55568:972-1268(-)
MPFASKKHREKIDGLSACVTSLASWFSSRSNSSWSHIYCILGTVVHHWSIADPVTPSSRNVFFMNENNHKDACKTTAKQLHAITWILLVRILFDQYRG